MPGDVTPPPIASPQANLQTKIGPANRARGGGVTALPQPTLARRGAVALREAIRMVDASTRAATVVGYGAMGREYVKALRALNVGTVRVVSRSAEPLLDLNGVPGVATIAGGYRQLTAQAADEEVGIVATPIEELMAAAEHLIACGFRRLLIEKPVALSADAVERLADRCERADVDAACAFNRVAYPSLIEASARIAADGGATSCAYEFTEMIRPEWLTRFSTATLSRWGVANSLHVLSMAHGLIGLPKTVSAYRAGRLAWHPSGAQFVGAGLSERGIPFSYSADWGSAGRWGVEARSAAAAYRLSPLETLMMKTSPTGEWHAVPLAAAYPQVKAGIVEQVAAMMDERARAQVALVPLRQACALLRFGASVFGYEHD